MEKSCRNGATFAADVLTVGCALVSDDPSCWKKHRLDAPAVVANDGVFNRVLDDKSLKITSVIPPNSTDIPYVYADFRDIEGPFRSFSNNEASIYAVREKLTALLRTPWPKEKQKLWGTSTVFHDEGLNDIDDEPAMYLIRSLSRATLEIRNYSLVVQIYDGATGIVSETDSIFEVDYVRDMNI